MQNSQPTFGDICFKRWGIIYYDISSTNKLVNVKGQWGVELGSQKLLGC